MSQKMSRVTKCAMSVWAEWGAAETCVDIRSNMNLTQWARAITHRRECEQECVDKDGPDDGSGLTSLVLEKMREANTAIDIWIDAGGGVGPLASHALDATLAWRRACPY